MDTKWKNSHKLGILIMILTIAAGTSLALASYPWLREQLFAGAQKVTEQMWAQGYEGYVAEIDGDFYCFTETWKTESRICLLILAEVGAVMLAALLTALIRPLGLMERKLFAVPTEIVGFLGVMAGCVVGGCMRDLVWMVICSVSGELKWEIIQELYVGDTVARVMVFTMNALFWAFGLFVFYWLTVCVLSPFRLGIRRWFTERTLCGRLFVWCRKRILRLCEQIQEVDLRDKPTKLILRIVAVNFLVLSLMSSFWFFGIFGILLYSVGLFVLLRRIWNRMQTQYGILLAAAGRMADGDLEVEIAEDVGIFEPLKAEMARIRSGFKKAVEEEVRSRSMKTELITNVSHDLKTPLTAIITYVNLLKNPDLTAEERDSYVQVLDQKSMRLKGLIEDLFEISKADSNNVSLNLMEVDVVAVMKEARLELERQIQESGVEFRWSLPEEKVLLWLDSEKTYRIFENLLTNIVKYALPGTRAYVRIEEKEDTVCVSMKNVSAAELSLTGDEMTGRFVRGDASRNTEGCGLGLAIAKSFTRLQKGTMAVDVDGDLFKVMLVWNKSNT